jgi:transposase IS66 family protein
MTLDLASAQLSYGQLASHTAKRLAFCEHHDRGDLLRFLHEPTIAEPTNNAAERALRPAVIARKVSHCSKNELGAAGFSAFKSVIGTLKKGGDVPEKLTNLIASATSQETAPANTS